ncbi:hypothetical protein PSU4_50810 [Pseudonocardia sulfidoxydans NBRC 16205]|uniref:AAA+ ATPase domain-containing protein n=3 Tax=Pseudonocardia sulfidoxydans TaxID=54011 RepID=A0A511DP39_9PSEU|nr:hypothetical protein PSU4_50810 [Pseudonocardia sulfidoxydans NBRC 16205]
MAQDAGELLRDTFGLPCIQELRPEALEPAIDTATSGEGARNVAVLFRLRPTSYTAGRRKDLDWIAAKPAAIENTSLSALHPGVRPAPTWPPVQLVTPVSCNPAQRAVLHDAMTQRLTVATGPPGTGKSQLVVNAVATAIAAGQSVLLASTNNAAVDEVHRRCAALGPGVLIRTGKRDVQKEHESAGLSALCAVPQPVRSVETRRLASAAADQHEAELTRAIAAKSTLEADLLRTGRARAAAEEQLGMDTAAVAAALGPRWAVRAAALSRARLLGEWRRRRFLAPARLTGTTVGICSRLAEMATLDRQWRELRVAISRAPADADFVEEIERSERALTEAARESVAGAAADRAGEGGSLIRTLAQSAAKGQPNWDAFTQAFPFVPGWAVTSLSARRFPTTARFDLVIIDEASQCSIPSVVPLLFRARRALVIGDAMQLPHISTITPRRDGGLRRKWRISREWLSARKLAPSRHSAFAACQQAADGSKLLDEHYRCHPEIIGVSNQLFYGGTLHILTDIEAPGRTAIGGSAIEWVDVVGSASRDHTGSWVNEDEIDTVLDRVEHLRASLPPDVTLGVVTPYRAQADRLRSRLRAYGTQVRVGTAHTFQGGERDVIVLSLVAAQNHPPKCFGWLDQQPELWNVAITRARSKLIVIGDQQLWEARGSVGGELARLARAKVTPHTGLDDDLASRLYAALRQRGHRFDIGVTHKGHSVDATFSVGDDDFCLLLDAGAPPGEIPSAHLRRMLRRQEILGPRSVRLPAWHLFDDSCPLLGELDRRR